MKRILMLCCAVLLINQTMAFAGSQLPKEELYLGGLHVGYPMGYVKSLYGEPPQKKWQEDRRHPRTVVYYITYEYSPTFRVIGRTTKGQSYEDEQNARVYSVSIKDNSLSTPSGIAVGMPYRAVAELFGETKKMTFPDGQDFYMYSFRGSDMYFDVNAEVIITEIHISPQD